MKKYSIDIFDYKGQVCTGKADIELMQNLSKALKANTSEELDGFVLKTIVPRLDEDNSISSYVAIFEENSSEIEYINARFILPDLSEKELYFTEFELNTMLKSNKVRIGGVDYIISESVYNIIVGDDDESCEDELILKCINPSESE